MIQNTDSIKSVKPIIVRVTDFIFAKNSLRFTPKTKTIEPEILARVDKRLREIDEEYRMTVINMTKYSSVLRTTTMITELVLEEQNKVVMFLVILV